MVEQTGPKTQLPAKSQASAEQEESKEARSYMYGDLDGLKQDLYERIEDCELNALE